MAGDIQNYDFAEIRKLLSISLDDPDLDALCMDHFPKVYDKFSRGMRKDEKITLLLDYCRRSSKCLDQLLDVIESSAGPAKELLTHKCMALNKQGQPCASHHLEPGEQLCREHLTMILAGKEVKDHNGDLISIEIARQQKRRQQRRQIGQLLFGWFSSTLGLSRAQVVIGFLAIIVTVIFGLANLPLVQGWLSIEPTPSPVSDASPPSVSTPTPLAGTPAAPGEIVIVIAKFHGAEGYSVQHRISQAIKDEIETTGIKNVRIIDNVEETISPDQENIENKVQQLGDVYDATAVIWGWMDKAGFTPNFTVTKAPDILPRVRLQEVPILPEETFQTYIREDLPAQMAYFTAWTVAQIYFWSEQIDQASVMFDRALAEAKQGNTDKGLELVYLYRGYIAIEFEPNPEQAIEEFDLGIQINPKLVALYNSRGIAYADLERYREAIADYDKAIEVYEQFGENQDYPIDTNFINQAFAYNNRCIAYTELEDFDRALEDCNKAIELQMGISEVTHPLVNRSYIFWRLDNPDAAIADLKAAIRYDPENLEAYVFLGRVYKELNELQDAIQWYQQAIAIDPHFSDAYYERGKIFEEQGNEQVALNDYTTAIEADPKNTRAYQARADLYRKLRQDDQALSDYIQLLLLDQDSDELVELCKRLDRCSEVIGQLQNLVDQADPSLHIALGHLYDRLEEPEKAIRHFSVALEMKTAPDVYVARASVYMKLSNVQAALEDYNKAIALAPEDEDAYEGRAKAYEELNRLDEALADYQKVMRIAPRSNYLYDDLHELCEKMANCEKVLKNLASEITGPSFDPNIYLILAKLNEELGNNEAAINYYSDFLELDQDDTWVYEERAELFEETDRLYEAVADYTIVLQQKPSATDIYTARAQVYERQGEYQLALADYDKAVQIDPMDRTALSSRASLHEKLGNLELGAIDRVTVVSTNDYFSTYDSDRLIEYCQKYNICTFAIEELDNIIEKSAPPTASAYYARGRLFEEANRLTEALADYDNAIAILSDEPDLFLAQIRIYQQLKNYAEVLTDYDHILALELSPWEASKIYIARAQVFEKLANQHKALEDYVSAILAVPESGAMDDVVRLCKELGECQTVLDRFDEKIKENPGNIAAYAGMGIIASELNEDDTALTAFGNAIERGSDSKEVFAGRAKIYARRGQYLQATQDYVQALSDERYNSPLVDVLIDTCLAGNTCQEAINLLNERVAAEASNSAIVKSFYFQSRIFARLEDVEQENLAYIKLLSGYTGDTWYSSELLRRCQETDGCQLAIDQLNQAIESNPEEKTMLYFTRGRLYAEQEAYEAALTDLGAVIDLDPGFSDIFKLRAEIYLKLHMPEEAIQDYIQVINYDSKRANLATSKIAELCTEFNLYDFALDSLNSSIRASPRKGWLYFLRGQIHKLLGNQSSVLSDFTQAIGIDPNQSTWLQARAEVYEQSDNYAAALDDYLQIASQSDRSSTAGNDLVRLCQRADLCDETVSKLNSAIQEQPDKLSLVLARAELYLAQNDTTASLNDYNRAVAMASSDPDIYQSRAEVREKVGDLNGALADHVKTISLGESDIDTFDTNKLAEYCRRHTNCYQAIVQLSNLIDTNISPNASAYYARGRLYEETDQLPEALADYNKTITLVNYEKDLILARARVNEQLGNYLEALADYDSILEITTWPDREIYISRAAVEEVLGNQDQALKDYISAVLAASYSVGPVDMVVRLCDELNTCPEILARFKQAVEEKPEHQAAHIALGIVSSHLGDFEEALTAFDTALELGDSKEASLKRAELLTEKGEYLQATSDYVQVLSGEWYNSPFVEPLIETCQTGNTCQEAIKLLNDWISDGTNDSIAVKSFYFQSRIYTALEDVVGANQAYVNLLLHTTETWYINNLIKYCKETNSCKITIEQLTQAITSNSENPVLYYARGKLYSESGNDEAAVADFSSVIALDPTFSDVFELRAKAFKNLQQAEQALEDFTYGILYTKYGYNLTSEIIDLCQETALCRSAMVSLNTAIATAPDNPWLYYARGRLSVEQGIPSLAIEDFTQAIDIDPDQLTWLQARAEVYEQLGKITLALDDYLQTLTISTFPDSARSDLVRFCQETDFCEETITKLTSMIHSEADNIGLILARAEIYAALDNTVAALDDYDRVISLTPSEPDNYESRANVREQAGDFTGALADYIKTISLDESNIYTAEDVIRLCQSLDNCEVVLKEFADILKPNSSKASILLARGKVYEALGDLEKAVIDISNAIETQNSSVSRIGYERRAVIYERQRNYEKAIEDYTILIEIFEYGEAYYHRALIYKELNQTDLAVQDFQAYLKTNPPSSRQKEVTEELTKLTQ